MNNSEIFLIAMTMIFAIPYLIWRMGRTEYYAPLVVVQILTGIVLGPGILGAAFPAYYHFVFNPAVVQALNGIAWWAVMLFVIQIGSAERFALAADIDPAYARAFELARAAGVEALAYRCKVTEEDICLAGPVPIG